MPPPLAPDTLIQSIKLWLLTNVVGTLLLGVNMSLHTGYLGSVFAFMLIAGIVAAGLSLPLVAIVVSVFDRIFRVRSQRMRLLLTVLALTAFWATPVATFFIVLGKPSDYTNVLSYFLPYYVAALLAGSITYRFWLFHNYE